MEENNKSVEICRIALKLAISSREEEREFVKSYRLKGIKTAAVDVGGVMPNSRFKFIENALIAAGGDNLIQDVHVHDGAIIGAM